jgi:hypothetical protein
MSAPVLQSRLTHKPWTNPALWRLPGILPLDPAEWLEIDDAYAGQMALRDALLRGEGCKAAVHGILPEALAPAQELYDLILARLAAHPDYEITEAQARRPDGVVVPLDREAPLLTLGRLVQEDLCLLQAQGAEHVLTGAVLCFPASWTLTEKLGRPLLAIHVPVPSYEARLAARVQRLFDAIRPEQPLWRMNALLYAVADLHHPRSEAEPPRPREGARPYLRSERQCLLRLPKTGAVVFSIHTHVVPASTLSPEEHALLSAGGH